MHTCERPCSGGTAQICARPVNRRHSPAAHACQGICHPLVMPGSKHERRTLDPIAPRGRVRTHLPRIRGHDLLLPWPLRRSHEPAQSRADLAREEPRQSPVGHFDSFAGAGRQGSQREAAGKAPRSGSGGPLIYSILEARMVVLSLVRRRPASVRVLLPDGGTAHIRPPGNRPTRPRLFQVEVTKAAQRPAGRLGWLIHRCRRASAR